MNNIGIIARTRLCVTLQEIKKFLMRKFKKRQIARMSSCVERMAFLEGSKKLAANKPGKQRFTTSKVSVMRTGIMDQNRILTIETYADNLALDIVEELMEIRQGEKTREETPIDLNMEVLNSLSGAINALCAATHCF